jgi:hypothetical protein
MYDIQLSDGTWVTTPVYAGVGAAPQCEGETCVWEDYGPPLLPIEGTEEHMVPVQMQRCRVCSWVRGRYLGNPHP